MERQGVEFKEVQFEKRIRSIEKAIGDGTTDGGSGLTPRDGDIDVDVDGIPAVSGLSLNPGDGRGIAIRWNDANVPQKDLDFYEVQFASDVGFTTDVHNYKTKDLQFTFSEGAVNTVYFARVRVSLNSGDVGAYSIILNTATGQAVTDDITDDAVTEPSSVLTTGSTTIAALASAVVQTLVIDKDGSDLYIIGALLHSSSGAAGTAANIANISIRKDGTEVIEMRPNTFGSRATPFMLIYPDTSGSVGSATYELFVDNVTILGLSITLTFRTLAAIELKR